MEVTFVSVIPSLANLPCFLRCLTIFYFLLFPPLYFPLHYTNHNPFCFSCTPLDFVNLLKAFYTEQLITNMLLPESFQTVM